MDTFTLSPTRARATKGEKSGRCYRCAPSSTRSRSEFWHGQSRSWNKGVEANHWYLAADETDDAGGRTRTNRRCSPPLPAAWRSEGGRLLPMEEGEPPGPLLLPQVADPATMDIGNGCTKAGNVLRSPKNSSTHSQCGMAPLISQWYHGRVLLGRRRKDQKDVRKWLQQGGYGGRGALAKHVLKVELDTDDGNPPQTE